MYVSVLVVKDCSPVEVAQSVSEVLNLQRLLSGTDVMELIDAFSEAEWEGEEEDAPEQGVVWRRRPERARWWLREQSGWLHSLFLWEPEK